MYIPYLKIKCVYKLNSLKRGMVLGRLKRVRVLYYSDI